MIQEILVNIGRPILTYGFSEEAAYRIHSLKIDQRQSTFVIERPDDKPALEINLNIPGRHNALNAAAAIAVATDEGIADSSIISGLAKFSGVGRRFEMIGSYPVNKDDQQGTAMLVDDYGHHPTELNATIEAVRDGWPDKRLVMVFQPHRYCEPDPMRFVKVLSKVDVLLILEVAAGGEPMVDATSKNLCRICVN